MVGIIKTLYCQKIDNLGGGGGLSIRVGVNNKALCKVEI
ncbi:Protein serine/threonine phosphatase 2C, C-terminal domain, partial [Moritella viscosa]